MNQFFEIPASPRVVAIGLTENELAQLRPFCGSLEVLDNLNKLFYPEQHDVLVTTKAEFHTGARIPRRVVFVRKPEVARPTGSASSSGHSYASPISQARTQYAPVRNLDIPSTADELGARSLVQRSCVPEPGQNYLGLHPTVNPARTVRPFLIEKVDNPLLLAGLFQDDKDYDSAFWLPDVARPFLAEWIKIAFARWRLTDPETFPETAEWKTSQIWSVAEELTARAALENFEATEVERLATAELQRRHLEAAITAAGVTGDGSRQLLTQTGDDLVRIVSQVFQELGFTVTDADQLTEHKGIKREDLRVEEGDWIALVEVKGYSGAAKSNDLIQTAGVVRSFVKTQKKFPDALWYVVNTYRETDPSQRPTVLAERAADLTAFSESHGGSVIDTRELFKLLQRVQGGELTADRARAPYSTEPRAIPELAEVSGATLWQVCYFRLPAVGVGVRTVPIGGHFEKAQHHCSTSRR